MSATICEPYQTCDASETQQVLSRIIDGEDLFEIDLQTISIPDRLLFGNVTSIPCATGTLILMC